MNEIDYIDPRLRRDDVLKELVFRVKSAMGGKSTSEKKIKAVKKTLKVATKAAKQARVESKRPVRISTRIKVIDSWD